MGNAGIIHPVLVTKQQGSWKTASFGDQNTGAFVYIPGLIQLG